MIKLSRAVQAISDDTALSLILRSPGVMIELHRYEGVEKTVNLPEILFNAYIRDMQSVADHMGQELPATVRDVIANKDRIKSALRAKFERSNMDIKAQKKTLEDEVSELGQPFKDWVVKEYKNHWHVLSDATLRQAAYKYKSDFADGYSDALKNTAQLKESQMEKEVPVKIAPVDEKALEKGKVVPKEENSDLKEKKPGLVNTQPIAGDEDSEAVEDTSLSEDSKANAERVQNLVGDVENLKSTLKEYLSSGFRMELTEDQLKNITSKVLSVVASFVTDITTERVEEIAGSILHVDAPKKGK
jgi:FtsZ-binding cell division protein ZapB